MYEELIETMSAKGYKTGILPVGYLESIRDEIQALHDGHIISDEVYQLIRQFHHYDYSDRDYPVNSVIVVASPSTLIRTYINYKGQRIAVIIPPTYIDYVTEPVTIETILNKVLNPVHYRASRVQSLPEKPLAVASGIAEYGRNNVTYVQGMGSFALLSVYYSDLPCPDESREYTTRKRAALCSKCTLCIRKCPTGAIEHGREVVRAEKCLTFMNEFTGDVSFPSWVQSGIHHCLIGCMQCQWHCPQNRAYLTRVKDSVEFDECETLLLLENKPFAELPSTLARKLSAINFSEFYYPFLSRNLLALIDNKTAP